MAATNKNNKSFHVVHEGEALDDLFSGIETPAGKVVAWIILMVILIALGFLLGVF